MIDYLDNVRKAGVDVWRASCPVHQGKDRNLKVTHTKDGAYIAYCFVCGVNQNDVARELRIPLAEIYPDYKPDKTSRPSYPAGNYRGKEQMRFDRLVIEEYNATREPSLQDRQAYKLAKARFERYNEKMQNWMSEIDE